MWHLCSTEDLSIPAFNLGVHGMSLGSGNVLEWVLSGALFAGPTGKGASAKAAAPAAAPDSDDDWDTGRSKGGGKGKKKGGGGGGSGAKSKKGGGTGGGAGVGGKAAAASASAGRGGAGGGTDVPSTLLSRKAIVAKIVEWFPELEDASNGLPGELADRIRPAALAEYERALSAVFAAGAERRRRLREVIARALDDAWQKLQLYSHGSEVTTCAGDRQVLHAVSRDAWGLGLRT